MLILTEKSSGKVIKTAEHILVEKNQFLLSEGEVRIYFPCDLGEIHEVDEAPEGEEWYYTKDIGFHHITEG